MVAAALCPRCQTPAGESDFCARCGAYLGDPTGTVERVTHTRRLFGDLLLETLPLAVTYLVFSLTIALAFAGAVTDEATLTYLLLFGGGGPVVLWFLWFLFTAGAAQTPAKRLVGTYVLDKGTGRPLGAGRMWVREVLVKMVLASFANAVIGVWWLVDGLWVFTNKNRQALHDLIGVGRAMQTLVVYAPGGLPAALSQRSAAAGGAAGRLRELARLRDEGLISEEEYQERRRKLVEGL